MLTIGKTLHCTNNFPLRISSVNVTKSAVSCGFGHFLLKKSLMKTSFFFTVLAKCKDIPGIPYLSKRNLDFATRKYCV